MVHLKTDWSCNLPLSFTPDEILDVRSPAEFAEDHMPGAVNLPVLDDLQRITVGTLHKQSCAFEARKIGAGLVTENISRHLHAHLAEKGRDYQPLVYCWRGGQRSQSMVTILRAVGWKAHLLEGGYKTFRRHVMTELTEMSAALNLRVINGLTGSGKTLLLKHLQASGAQILDLEELAAHRSSLLGKYIDREQPSQCAYETLIWEALSHHDLSQPIYIEAESRKVGNLHLPTALWERMLSSPVVELKVPDQARVEHLIHEYEHFLESAEWREHLAERLQILKERVGSERLAAWADAITHRRWHER